MAETTCVSSPTLTSNVISTSQSSSLTTSESVTVIPGGVSSSLSTSCSTVSPNTTSCETSTVVVTSPGVTSTQIVTLTVNVNIPVTNQVTLYGSSCRTITSDTPYTPPPSSNTPPPSTIHTTSTTYTPTTSFSTFTTSSLLTTDGSTYVTYVTSTTTTVPSMQASPPPPSSSNNTGAIVGGTLGGIAVLGLLALLTWHMIKKSHRFDNLFGDAGDDGYFNPAQKDPLSDPYQYGPVGQQDLHQPIGSPPTSPGFQHSSLGNDTGLYNAPPGNEMGGGASGNSTGVGLSGNEIGTQPNDFGYNVPNQAPVHHLRNASLVPLLVGIGATAAGAGAASGHTRPNTSSSTGRVSTSSDPVGPLISHAPPPQSMGYPPQQFASYPPALANYALQQAFGTAQVQAPQGPLQQDLGHNTSVGSTGTVGSGSGSSGSNLAPMGSVIRRLSQYPQQPYRPAQQQQRYEDPFARSGTPVSFHEGRVLQVMNAEPSAVGEGSSSGGGGALATPGLFVVGSSSGAALIDGKGRQLISGGEKAGLVHLDGGAYQDPLQSERPGTPAPPAYAE